MLWMHIHILYVTHLASGLCIENIDEKPQRSQLNWLTMQSEVAPPGRPTSSHVKSDHTEYSLDLEIKSSFNPAHRSHGNDSDMMGSDVFIKFTSSSVENWTFIRTHARTTTTQEE